MFFRQLSQRPLRKQGAQKPQPENRAWRCRYVTISQPIDILRSRTACHTIREKNDSQTHFQGNHESLPAESGRQTTVAAKKIISEQG